MAGVTLRFACDLTAITPITQMALGLIEAYWRDADRLTLRAAPAA